MGGCGALEGTLGPGAGEYIAEGCGCVIERGA